MELATRAPIICPAILAADKEAYAKQIHNIASFAHRIQIDLTDGAFARHRTITPEETWWPVGILADFHLMYRDPLSAIQKILHHKPNMIIVHAEADGDFSQVVDFCRNHSVKLGVALLPRTAVENIFSALREIDHVLIFSGDLGSFGGQADFNLLEKVRILKHTKPDIEIGWDGGINDQNVSHLVSAGVDVLNVGGFIQNSHSPDQAFKTLQRIADETGTT
jgi:ribulose-phosphate 3-epimerase